MRLKFSYNCLGSGCPFYYRDIFSGLSNEKVGTASYNFSSVNTPGIVRYFYPLFIDQLHLICRLSHVSHIRDHSTVTQKFLWIFRRADKPKNSTIKNTPALTRTIAYYEPLLLRYAGKMIHNEALSAQLVREVLESQYNVDGLTFSKNLRQALKSRLLALCRLHQKLQVFTDPGLTLQKEERNGIAIKNNSIS
ncbi:MAG TPA: hypothetical protein VK498_13015 [Ferruginibacter sp.]|nr:hypothetical protein [Ferruginibacter sp.]